MKLFKIDITANQKKIIIASAIGAFIFLLFWIFLYYPSSKEIARLKRALNLTQQQIQGIEMFLTGSKSRDEAIRILKQKQQYLESKFPQKEEESLRLISEIARDMNIEVVSLQPQSRTEFQDASAKQVVIEGKIANYLPITLEVICSYKDLVKYTVELKNILPAFISISSLNVKKEVQSAGKVRASIDFNLYLLI